MLGSLILDGRMLSILITRPRGNTSSIGGVFVLNRIDSASYDVEVKKDDKDAGGDTKHDADDARIMLLGVVSCEKDASHDPANERNKEADDILREERTTLLVIQLSSRILVVLNTQGHIAGPVIVFGLFELCPAEPADVVMEIVGAVALGAIDLLGEVFFGFCQKGPFLGIFLLDAHCLQLEDVGKFLGRIQVFLRVIDVLKLLGIGITELLVKFVYVYHAAPLSLDTARIA